MGKTVVIYHGGCTDGFCAAWLFKHAFPEAQFYSAQYGQPVPYDGVGEKGCLEHGLTGIDSDDNVFIVDFSYPREEMLRLAGHLTLNGAEGSLLVLDHHKTAEEACRSLDFCRFDSSKSGARLAWEYLRELQVPNNRWYGLLHSPMIVDYVEDRDLWRWKLKDSKAINAAIRSYPMTFQQWDEIYRWIGPNQMISEGSAILRYRQGLIDQHVRNAREIEVKGYRVLAANCTCGEIISEVAEALISECSEGSRVQDDTGHRPFGACYFDLANENKRVYSLRSRGDFDVSVIAKQFGGGGHKNSASFTTWRPADPVVVVPSMKDIVG